MAADFGGIDGRYAALITEQMQEPPVTDDASGLAYLHPDDRQWLLTGVLSGIHSELRAIMEASAVAPAQAAPGRPPANFDGLDAKQFDRFRSDLLRDMGDAMREATKGFLPEGEIDERIDAVKSTIDKRFDGLKESFLSEVRKVVAEENTKLRTEFFEIFADLDMPLDKGEKLKATRNKLAGLFEMQATSKEFKSELWKMARASIIAWIVGLFSAALGYIGWKGGAH